MRAAIEAEQGLTFIHPYDDPDVIAGQGTVGMEILRQHPDPIEAVFVPIGGGGLAAGIAVYVKFLRPEIKVIGVEPDDAASMGAAITAGERVIARSGRACSPTAWRCDRRARRRSGCAASCSTR